MARPVAALPHKLTCRISLPAPKTFDSERYLVLSGRHAETEVAQGTPDIMGEVFVVQRVQPARSAIVAAGLKNCPIDYIQLLGSCGALTSRS